MFQTCLVVGASIGLDEPVSEILHFVPNVVNDAKSFWYVVKWIALLKDGLATTNLEQFILSQIASYGMRH